MLPGNGRINRSACPAQPSGAAARRGVNTRAPCAMRDRRTQKPVREENVGLGCHVAPWCMCGLGSSKGRFLQRQAVLLSANT